MTIFILSMSLTLSAIGYACWYWWRERRCEKYGHRWVYTPDGLRCTRCPKTLTEGDAM